MSIIHNALKKIQQRVSPKTDEMQVSSSTTTQTASSYLYEKPAEVEILPPKQNKIKSVLALLCAIVIILGSFGFLYKQWHAYFPKVKKLAKAPEDLVPLAKLPVNPPIPANLPSPTKLPAISNTAIPNAPQTLNIHGVMSNATVNLVLINDQV